MALFEYSKQQIIGAVEKKITDLKKLEKREERYIAQRKDFHEKYLEEREQKARKEQDEIFEARRYLRRITGKMTRHKGNSLKERFLNHYKIWNPLSIYEARKKAILKYPVYGEYTNSYCEIYKSPMDVYHRDFKCYYNYEGNEYTSKIIEMQLLLQKTNDSEGIIMLNDSEVDYLEGYLIKKDEV